MTPAKLSILSQSSMIFDINKRCVQYILADILVDGSQAAFLNTVFEALRRQVQILFYGDVSVCYLREK